MLAVLANETSAIIPFRLTQFLCYISPEERAAVEVKMENHFQLVVKKLCIANTVLCKFRHHASLAVLRSVYYMLLFTHIYNME